MAADSETRAAPLSAPGDDDSLIDYLRNRDVVCPQCDYNLRGLVTPRCPECGQALKLAVALVEPYLKAWIALLVACCAGAGLGFFFLVIIVMSFGWPGPGTLLLNLSIIVHLLMIPAAGVVVVARRRLLRLTRETQWRIAVAVAMVLIAALLVFFAEVR
jgi:hypothetical protein